MCIYKADWSEWSQQWYLKLADITMTWKRTASVVNSKSSLLTGKTVCLINTLKTISPQTCLSGDVHLQKLWPGLTLSRHVAQRFLLLLPCKLNAEVNTTKFSSVQSVMHTED